VYRQGEEYVGSRIAPMPYSTKKRKKGKLILVQKRKSELALLFICKNSPKKTKDGWRWKNA
jgi:hypothetical protein